MLVSGDWITPHFNGFVFLDKPAVYFWMVAASLRTFGVSEGAARLPSALMGVATMLLAWFLARRMFGDAAGLRAGIVFATCPLALALAREVIFDMTLTFFVTVAMVAFWLAEENNFLAPRFDALMFAAMGVAVITKGFVGILIPLIAILIYEAARGRWREWLRLRWGWGLLVFLALTLPWFIAVSTAQSGFPSLRFLERKLEAIFQRRGAPRRGNPLLLSGLPRGLLPVEHVPASRRLESSAEMAGIEARGGPAHPILALLGDLGICLLYAFAFQASRVFPARARSFEHPHGIRLARRGPGSAGAAHRIGLRQDLLCY